MAHAVEATEPGYAVRTRDVHRTDRCGQVLVPVLRSVNREDQRGGVLRRPERPVAAAENVTSGEWVTVRQDFSTPSSGGQVHAAAVVIVPATASTTSGGGG